MSGVFVRILALIRLQKLGASIFHTIVFNMRMLPFKEAIQLPFILFGRVSYSECVPYKSGEERIRRIGKSRLKFNSWQIGRLTYHLSNSNQITRLAVKGTLILGERGKFYNGSNIEVQEGGELKIGTGTVVGSYSRII